MPAVLCVLLVVCFNLWSGSFCPSASAQGERDAEAQLHLHKLEATLNQPGLTQAQANVALLQAIAYQDAMLVHKALSQGASANARLNLPNYYALEIALKLGNLPILEALLSQGANPQLATAYAPSIFAEAAADPSVSDDMVRGLWEAIPADKRAWQIQLAFEQEALYPHTERMHFLIKLLPLSEQASVRRELAMWASHHNHLVLMRFLLSVGFAPQEYDRLGQTALFYAVAHSDGEMVSLLLQHGADPNQFTQKGLLPLQELLRYALSAEDVEKNLTSFLEYGVDLNLAEKEGSSPLWVAIQESDSDLAIRLIALGADPHQTESEKTSLLHELLQKTTNPSSVLELGKILLRRGISPNLADEEGFTPLMNAIRFYEKDWVSLLLAYKADPNRVNHNGKTALMLASLHNQQASLEQLTRAGARWDAKEHLADPPLFQVIRNQNLALVKWMLEQGVQSPNQPQAGGLTPLMAAAESGNLAIFEYLLSRGSRAAGLSSSGRDLMAYALSGGNEEIIQAVQRLVGKNARPTPLTLIAAAEGRNLKQLEAAIAQSSDINQADKNGWTALHAAIESGHAPSVELLLAKGANPFVRTQKGLTTLMVAIYYAKNTEILRLLLPLFQPTEGLQAHTQTGETVIHYAVTCCSIEARKMEILQLLAEAGYAFEAPHLPITTSIWSMVSPYNEEIIHFLLEQGVDPNIVGPEGWTPLISAAEADTVDTLGLLLEYGANPNHPQDQGKTALDYSAGQTGTEALKLLLTHGANPNLPGHSGWTVFLSMVEANRPQQVALLLAHGAHVDQALEEGWTPLMIAAEHADGHVLELLIDAGADPF